MMDIIQLDHISKRFAHKILFDDVILRITEGTIVGFKGANGCGKSVLFKIISGLYRPDSGDVYVRGKKIGDAFDYPPDMGIFRYSLPAAPVLTAKTFLLDRIFHTNQIEEEGTALLSAGMPTLISLS